MGYSSEHHMREAYEKKDFLKLAGLLARANPKSFEAEFYRGVMAEYGLGRAEENKIEAEEHYKKAFAEGHGFLNAGNHLARMYQKQGQEQKAGEIYKKIIRPFNVVKDQFKFVIDPDDSELYYKNLKISIKDIGQPAYLKIRNSLRGESLSLSAEELQSLQMLCSSTMEVAYASYRLARISSDEVLNGSLYQTKELEDETVAKIKQAKKLYEGAKAIYKELAPHSRGYAKTLYNEAKLEWRLLELEQVNKKWKLEGPLEQFEVHLLVRENKLIYKTQNIELEILPDSINSYKNIRTKVLERSSLSSKEREEVDNVVYANQLNKIKNQFKKSLDTGYVKASAEICNIEAIALSSEKAILKYDEALKLDPDNDRAKLLKAKALGVNLAEKDTALTLVRDILLTSPKNEEAIRYSNELQRQLSRIIASKISEKLMDETKHYDQEVSWLVRDEFSMRRKYIIGELAVNLTASLNNSEFLKKEALFSKANDITSSISNKIIIEYEADLKKAILDGNKTVRERLNFELPGVVSLWEKELKKDKVRADSDKPEDALLIKRRKFEKQVAEKLRDLYFGFYLATKGQPTVDLKIEYGSFEKGLNVAGKVLPLAAGFLGPIGGGVWVGLAATGAQITKEQIIEWRKEAACSAAKEFCKIGNRDPDVAQLIFNEVAQKLVKTYGMQIDKIKDNDTDINQLSDVAVERMLCHMNNRASYNVLTKFSGAFKAIKSFLAEPGDATKYIGAFLSGDKKERRNKAELLFEGIIEGQAEEVTVNNVEGKEWELNDLFTKPAITKNGKDFYCKDDSDPKKYGARYELLIPDGYSLDEADKITAKQKKDIGVSFNKHKERLDLQYYNTEEKKLENKDKEESITRKDRAKKEVAYDRQVKVGWLGVFMGMGSLYAAKIAGITSFLGLSPAAAIPLAATLGITSAVLMPLAITCAVVGAFLLIKGATEVHKGNSKLEALLGQKVEDEPKTKESSKTKEIDEHVEQKKREAKFEEKFNKNAKFSHAEQERKRRDSGPLKEVDKAEKKESTKLMDVLENAKREPKSKLKRIVHKVVQNGREEFLNR